MHNKILRLAVVVAIMSILSAAFGTSYTRAGGRIMKPAKGRIALINCQKHVSSEALAQEAHDLFDSFMLPLEVAEASVSTLADIPNVMRSINANVAVLVLNDAALPMTLVAVESGWGIINVAPLLGDSPSTEKLLSRLKKLETRTFLHALGAAYSPGNGSVMCAVSSLDDLDAIRDTTFEPAYTVNMMMYAQTRGIVPAKMVSYEKACEEGWAPAPKNEYEKAVWDEVRAIPQEPMKIKYDPKEGK